MALTDRYDTPTPEVLEWADEKFGITLHKDIERDGELFYVLVFHERYSSEILDCTYRHMNHYYKQVKFDVELFKIEIEDIL